MNGSDSCNTRFQPEDEYRTRERQQYRIAVKLAAEITMGNTQRAEEALKLARGAEVTNTDLLRAMLEEKARIA